MCTTGIVCVFLESQIHWVMVSVAPSKLIASGKQKCSLCISIARSHFSPLFLSLCSLYPFHFVCIGLYHSLDYFSWRSAALITRGLRQSICSLYQRCVWNWKVDIKYWTKYIVFPDIVIAETLQYYLRKHFFVVLWWE